MSNIYIYIYICMYKCVLFNSLTIKQLFCVFFMYIFMTIHTMVSFSIAEQVHIHMRSHMRIFSVLPEILCLYVKISEIHMSYDFLELMCNHQRTHVISCLSN